MEGAGLHLADEGTTAFVRDPGAAQRLLERPNLFEGKRVPLLKRRHGTCRSQAHQSSGIHAEAGEFPGAGDRP